MMGSDLKKETRVTAEEGIEILNRPIVRALEDNGITPAYLARKLKAELNAYETKFIKTKGYIPIDHIDDETGDIVSVELPNGYKWVLDGVESVIEANMVNWTIRQKARMDAQKLLDHYPSEKHDHTGEVKLKLVYDDPPKRD